MAMTRGRGMATPVWPKIASKVSASAKHVSFPVHAASARLRRWEGERKLVGGKVYDYHVTPEEFELTVAIPLTEVEDDNLGAWQHTLEDMGVQIELWPDDLVIAALLAGETGLSFDGRPFFANDHSLRTGTTIDNLFGSTALTKANVAAVIAEMKGWVGEDGRSLRVTPNKLVVPPSLEDTAREIVGSDLIAQCSARTLRLLVFGTRSRGVSNWRFSLSWRRTQVAVTRRGTSSTLRSRRSRSCSWSGWRRVWSTSTPTATTTCSGTARSSAVSGPAAARATARSGSRQSARRERQMAYATRTDLTRFGIASSALAGVAEAAQEAALAAASDVADSYLRSRYELPLVTYGDDLRRAVCAIAAWDILTVRGYDPNRGGDEAVKLRHDSALKWLADVSLGRAHVSGGATLPTATRHARAVGPLVGSDRVRGW
jgi:Mu-like prophage major head subunit gpT